MDAPPGINAATTAPRKKILFTIVPHPLVAAPFAISFLTIIPPFTIVSLVAIGSSPRQGPCMIDRLRDAGRDDVDRGRYEPRIAEVFISDVWRLGRSEQELDPELNLP
jgi:hypothetical protein